MASSNNSENVMQCQTCHCGEGDTNLWVARASDNPDKQTNKCPNCDVLKSGHLLISSKGIGWTSWKKRWFVLTRTSLVFYRADPATIPQKGNETNATLGGMDLNSSGSVVVKADKKLITVLFPDGRDGRTFTLKAETPEDLYEWKTALENALAQAPSAALSMGQNGTLQNDAPEPIDTSSDQCVDKEPAISSVIGRPIMHALEDADGSPSFLEKALRFIEEHGVKVEGILRQSADVEEVKRRLREYDQGKVEFSSDEDAHVIGDCIKYVLREMPSSPVPASCCTSLVDAYRTDRSKRVDAIRTAIYETFPEPNLRLMQRILNMMQRVAAYKSQNRMSLSAIAACMAPLLLRPLLAGDCEFQDDFNMGGDGSLQLLKAAAAANHAQLIVIILLEEFDKIFNEDYLHDGSMSSEIYSDSEEGDVEDDGSTGSDVPEDDQDEYDSNDESTDNEVPDDGYHDPSTDKADDLKHSCSETNSESCSTNGSDSHDYKRRNFPVLDKEIASGACKFPTSEKKDDEFLQKHDVASTSVADTSLKEVFQQKSSSRSDIFPVDSCAQKDETLRQDTSIAKNSLDSVSNEPIDGSPTLASNSVSHVPPAVRVGERTYEAMTSTKKAALWGRAPAKKKLSTESIDLTMEDETAIQKLEDTMNDLENKIAKEVKGNEILKESLEKRKEALYERRLALEREVIRLQKQLQTERDMKASLEAGLMNMRPGHASYSTSIDGKTRADLEEVAHAEADIVILKQKVADLQGQLNDHQKQSYASLCESCGKHLYNRDRSEEKAEVGVVTSTRLVNQQEKLLKQPKDAKTDKQPVSSLGPESLSKEQAVTTNSISEKSTSEREYHTARRSNRAEDSVKAGEITASKILSPTSDAKKETSMQWPSSIALNILKSQASGSISSSEELTVTGHGGPATTSSGTEGATSSSAALTKLTNRLNFLRERRAQLANEIKVAQNYHHSGSDGRPPDN